MRSNEEAHREVCSISIYEEETVIKGILEGLEALKIVRHWKEGGREKVSVP